MFKINFQIFVLSCLCLSFSYCCQLIVRRPYPLLIKNFGSKNITFRASGKGVTLNKGESVEVYCGSGLNIENSNGYTQLPNNQYQTALLFCDENNYIRARGIYENRHESEVLRIYCSSSSSESLYESKRKLGNCEGSMSYVIGEKIPFLGTIKKLAMCYDIDNFALKYANYIAYQKKDILISYEDNFDNDLEVDLEQKVDNLENYFDFMSQDSFTSSRDRQQNVFFNAFKFDYDLIIQDEQLNKKFDSWNYMLNTMWWSKLRQNNWRFFLDALEERTNSVKYRVYVGTYGNATLPATESSNGQPEAVAVQTDGLAVTAPLYIWAYLKSLSPGNDEDFVVLAHNSPYSQSPDHTEFCASDFCDDIQWLNDSRFGRLRRIPTFGYTFCCRAEEVAKVIDYFPVATLAIETSTAAAAAATSQ
ncbi:PREDICTED: uncharacterized protein LOC108366462 [Rhagoletis zephyria]|uniref:uncharacterized protein LOC108366462 n=1 Tax=Rhagoletis zephyria TaxID=28612 RepID=UPI00081125BC|nr:PREDICTED: uncharacterized protein LOC108366462 [Rhagoletis zephyria]